MVATEKKRIVIVGGGFGGVFAAKYLRRNLVQDVAIELINESNYFVFQPLLPEVVSGIISARDAVTPLRLLLPGVKVRMAEVRGIDFQAKELQLVQGSKRRLIRVRYDQLLLAPGQKSELSRFSGAAEHAFGMRDVADAHALRNHIIQCLEHADVTEDAELKKQLLTFVVAGGGFSGIESMGELWEMIQRMLKLYPQIRREGIRGIVLQIESRILPELPGKLARYAHKKLVQRGVQIELHTGLASVTRGAVMLSDGRRIASSTVVAAVGNGPHDWVTRLPVVLQGGRFKVDAYLQLQGCEDAWAVGDAAAVPLSSDGDKPRYAPPTAQFAVREARCAAYNILAALKGSPLRMFSYKPIGMLASIGHYRAVGEILGWRFSGVFAWLLWRGTYMAMVPSLVTRLRIALNWLFDYFLPRNSVQIKQKSLPACRYIHLAKGDVLFRPGEIADGFYVVVQGALQFRVEADEAFVKILKPGEHWGERVISRNREVPGTLTALEDTRVLVLQRADFNALRASFPSLNTYFEGLPDSKYSDKSR